MKEPSAPSFSRMRRKVEFRFRIDRFSASIHSTTVAYVALRKSVAMFLAHGSGFDSVDDIDNAESPERFGSSVMVVCPGGVANAIFV